MRGIHSQITYYSCEYRLFVGWPPSLLGTSPQPVSGCSENSREFLDSHAAAPRVPGVYTIVKQRKCFLQSRRAVKSPHTPAPVQ